MAKADVKGGSYRKSKTGNTKLVSRTKRPRRGVDQRTDKAWPKGTKAPPATETEAPQPEAANTAETEAPANSEEEN